MLILRHSACAFAASLVACAASARTVTSFNDGWSFAKAGAAPQPVDLPHDWAIAGPFDPKGNGDTGKLPWRGEGTYTRTLVLTEKPKGRLFVEFDGVMARADFLVNGTGCGRGEYGYLGFRGDMTPLLLVGTNYLTVTCDTLSHASRWYPGGGIYRNVRLVKTDNVYFVSDALKITTKDVLTRDAKIKIEGLVVSRRAERSHMTVAAILKDAAGQVVARSNTQVEVDGYDEDDFDLKLKVSNPHLWQMERNAYLYTLELTMSGEGFTDNLTRRIGLREFTFKADEGFFLNGRRVQLQGVDLHADLGPLGMAVHPGAVRRQLEVMRDMGANALRTSHNPPAPEVLDVCDELGIFVWDECFDKWNGTCGIGKAPIEEFVSRYLEVLVRRDRNHPCVFVWSIGNEISPGKARPPGQEGWSTGAAWGTSAERSARFRHVIRKLDTSRPVAIGSCFPSSDVRGDHEPLDLVGWNYGEKYRVAHTNHPSQYVLYSESASAVSEYGYYAPHVPTNKAQYARDVFHLDSYDLNSVPWGDIADHEFYRMERDAFCAGEFVWTGIDYLGEPSPYGAYHLNPKDKRAGDAIASRSSYFGICDLLAFPKDRFYLYRSHWNREAFTLHLVPAHWTFPERVGQTLSVFAYTSADEAELFLNGRSLGRRRKDKSAVPTKDDYYAVLPRYRLIWKDVPYEAGELKVVAYGASGETLGAEVLHTAGAPTHVVLTPEKRYGTLCVVKVTLADKDGNFVPNADRRVRFAAEGCRILAVGNSDPRGYDSFKDVTSHPLKFGRAGVFVEIPRGSVGKLTASADGVASAELPFVANP